MTEIELASIEPIVELYVGNCKSVSGRSALTYVVGKDEVQNTLHLRIAGNTGKGMWCKGWASAQAVEAILSGGVDLTAKSFQKLHPGKSINTGGFVLAALLDLGLVRPGELNTRVHEQVPTASFDQVVSARLKDVGVIDGSAESPRKARRKAKESN